MSNLRKALVVSKCLLDGVASAPQEGHGNPAWLRDGLPNCHLVTWFLNLSFPLLFHGYYGSYLIELFQWLLNPGFTLELPRKL